jgi:hypothetical protein
LIVLAGDDMREKTNVQVEEKLEQIDRLLEIFPDRYQFCPIVSTSKLMVEKYKKRMKHNNYYVSQINELLVQGGRDVGVV